MPVNYHAAPIRTLFCLCKQLFRIVRDFRQLSYHIALKIVNILQQLILFIYFSALRLESANFLAAARNEVAAFRRRRAEK